MDVGRESEMGRATVRHWWEAVEGQRQGHGRAVLGEGEGAHLIKGVSMTDGGGAAAKRRACSRVRLYKSMFLRRPSAASRSRSTEV